MILTRPILTGIATTAFVIGVVSLWNVQQRVTPNPGTAQLEKRVDQVANKFGEKTALLEELIKSKSDKPYTDFSNSNKSASEKQFAALQAELDKTRAQLSELADRFEQTSLSQNKATVFVHNSLTPEQQAQLDIENKQEQDDFIELRFSNETTDPDWSLGAVDQLTAALTKTNITINELSCATTMCRMTATLPSEGEVSEVYRTMDEHLAWEGEMYVTVNHDTGEMLAFLSRPGNNLPRVNQQ